MISSGSMLECFTLKKIIIVLAPSVEGEVEKYVGRNKVRDRKAE